MGMSTGGGAGVKSDINVTPLVDVVLVLLIIFMVVTPMLQKGQAVRLPVAKDPPQKPEDKNQTLVTVTEKNQWYLEKDLVPEAQFDAKIAEEFQRNPSNSVVIKGDARLTYGDVKKVMLKIKNANFKTVGLVTQQRDQR